MNASNPTSFSRKKKHSRYLLISLLFHLILFLFFARFAFKEKDLLQEQQEQYDTDVTFELPAELRPRQGTLDETQDELYEPSAVSLQSHKPIPQQQEQIVEKQTAVVEEQPQLQEPEKKSSERLSRQELKQFALNNLLKKKPPQEKQEEIDRKNHPLIPQAPVIDSLSKNQLFSIPMGMTVDSNPGNDLAQRMGDPNKRPNPEELKYISYARRIAKMLSDNLRFLVNYYFNNHIEVSFEFDKKGYVVACTSQSTTSRTDLSERVVSTIKELSPFPPIPDHWKCDSVLPTVTLHWRKANQPVLHGAYSFQAFGSQ